HVRSNISFVIAHLHAFRTLPGRQNAAPRGHPAPPPLCFELYAERRRSRRSCRKLEFELYADLGDSRILIHGGHGAKPAVCGRRVRTGPSIRMVKGIQELSAEVNMHAFPN